MNDHSAFLGSIDLSAAATAEGFLSLGLIAAAIHLLSHAVYIRQVLANQIQPNATSFLMFAYGSALMTLLEWRVGASWPVLALPVSCAVLDFGICLLCLRKPATRGCDRFEKSAFAIDVVLTVAYVSLATAGSPCEGCEVPFLLATNLSSIVGFVPVLRSTWKTPEREQPGPWLIAATAYALLGLEIVQSGAPLTPVLLVYPLLNMVLHLVLVGLTCRRELPTRSLANAFEGLSFESGSFSGVLSLPVAASTTQNWEQAVRGS